MGANESAFGPSPKAVEAMAEAAASGHYYNDPDGYELRSAIAAHHGVGIENVVLGAGIDDLLLLICRALLEPGATAVSSLGGYPTFAYSVAGVGALLLTEPYREDRPDLEALALTANRSAGRVVYLADPDNPSGSASEPSEVKELRKRLPAGCALLLDQAYADFVDRQPTFQTEDAGVIRLRTFSKAHGLAGLRVGYALMASESARMLERIRLHFSVNRVAQAGALASLADREFLFDVVAQTAAARAELSEIGSAMGLRPIPSSANFVTFDAGSRERAERILAELQKRGVFIRKPGKPPLDSCIRVSVGLPADQALFRQILAEVVERRL